MTPNLHAYRQAHGQDLDDLPPAPNPADLDQGEHRLPATSFRSRRSALSGAQRQTWERLWPELGKSEVRPPHAEPLDATAWFG
ncbi:MAG: hypothetical protein ABSD32_19390, partial [Mycobacterium sp.]